MAVMPVMLEVDSDNDSAQSSMCASIALHSSKPEEGLLSVLVLLVAS